MRLKQYKEAALIEQRNRHLSTAPCIWIRGYGAAISFCTLRLLESDSMGSPGW